MEDTSTQEIVEEQAASLLTEGQEYKLEIIPPYSVIQCRRSDIIYRNGVEIARSYHRHVRSPGDDVSHDCTELQAVAAALWTPEVVAAYEASLEPVVLPAPEEEVDEEFGVEAPPTYRPISELL